MSNQPMGSWWPCIRGMGEVIQPGKNLGSTRSVYWYMTYLPEARGCRFYEARRIARTDSRG
jgi:hypothetical protein